MNSNQAGCSTYNFRDFGVIGDGVEKDTAVIQRAIVGRSPAVANEVRSF